MAKLFASLAVLLALLITATCARRNGNAKAAVAPADACAAGCDDGFVCKPDKDAGCNRTSISTDPSCWSCLQAPPKKPNSPPGRPVAPADACAAGCDDGFVCKPDKDAGCKRTSISTDASCWSCLQAPTPKPTRRRRRRQRKTRDPN